MLASFNGCFNIPRLDWQQLLIGFLDLNNYGKSRNLRFLYQGVHVIIVFSPKWQLPAKVLLWISWILVRNLLYINPEDLVAPFVGLSHLEAALNKLYCQPVAYTQLYSLLFLFVFWWNQCLCASYIMIPMALNQFEAWGTVTYHQQSLP